MNTKILTLGLVATLFLNACKDTAKQDQVDKLTETTTASQENITTTTSTNKDGKTLELAFNHNKGTVIIKFDGDTSELQSQKPASGFWYKNEQYELRGKGNDIELKKEGELIFSHQDDIVNTSLKNAKGQTLDMTFNNSTNTVKLYLNGGEQIELAGEKAASGIWYKNEQYELRGKGLNLELKKDGKIVFEN
ncbi:hypothetical protein FEZ18_06425 [Oceanihabitans sp. IOP_32]|uniref:MliC family protein n=1 Tax=Oceanihabitans sp. IOP_32 TaxID=2529032 RepID=UPI00129315EB|nr:MliC family protein [Oceanihabitans sp. IOP_32]QFZ54455.1 hypothetical protein FEZ18_06425 [Oceanihabitans sp. IOP_32]